ncbi:MAG: glycogen/starch synthase [Candidatus Eisenbacteria bacterium]
MSEVLRVALVATEASPLARHGGRADIVAAVANSLARRGHQVTLFLPAYRDLTFPEGSRRETLRPELRVPDPAGIEPAALIRVTLPLRPEGGRSPEIILVHHRGNRRFFDRPGLWTDPADGTPYPDNAARFAFFGRAVLEGLKALDAKPDLVHAFDARAAWTLGLLKRVYADDAQFVRTGTLISALDLDDQEPQPAAALVEAGLEADAQEPWGTYDGDALVPLLKIGLRHADLVVLPSKTHAAELLEDRALARELAPVLSLRAADTVGVVHGIDAAVWDPAGDAAIAAPYTATDLAGKARCRHALAERAGWPSDPAESGHAWPIVGLIAKLTDEQGMALVTEALDRLLALDARYFVLGLGDRVHHVALGQAAQRHPDRLFARLTFDDTLVREIVAGADLFLLPTLFEPTGRQALRAMRYGAVPVAHKVGGLADVVTDFDPVAGTGTGFTFLEPTPLDLASSLAHAIDTFHQPHAWRRLVRNAMTHDGSWEATAAGYEVAYREVRRRVEAKRFGAWAMGIARG